MGSERVKLRITGGQLRGRYLSLQADDDFRPSTERLREALFSSLEAHGALREAKILELFAGSGIFSLEALSRGARFATVVEARRTRIKEIEENARQLALGEKTKIVCQDALEFLLRPSPEDRKNLSSSKAFDNYSLIFADPPYDYPHLEELCRAVISSPLTQGEALFILETSKRVQLPTYEALAMSQGGLARELRRFWQREYGDSALRFYLLTSEPCASRIKPLNE